MLKDFKMGLLGNTGLKVGRLGLAASYGAPAEAFEEAFEKRCDYFYFGSGRHNNPPSKKLVEMALSLKEKELVKFPGMSGHNRSLFPQMAKEKIYDLFHIRYNASHRRAEDDLFPYLKVNTDLVAVSYTATRWGNLLKSGYMPKGKSPLKASDCYRFVLSNPLVDVCLYCLKNINEMQEALSSLELGLLDHGEMNYIKMIGYHAYSSSKNFFYSKF